MGPPPKPAAQRRRRNAPTAGAAVLEGPQRRAPKLPGSKELLASTRSWWRTVWASPMASRWTPADEPALVRLAHLKDLTDRELRGWTVRMQVGDLEHDENRPGLVRVVLAGAMVSVQLLAEMRQLEDRLGLTPMARRRLGWELPGEDDQAASADAPPDELAAARRERFTRASGAS
jgi:hypothetical protein